MNSTRILHRREEQFLKGLSELAGLAMPEYIRLRKAVMQDDRDCTTAALTFDPPIREELVIEALRRIGTPIADRLTGESAQAGLTPALVEGRPVPASATPLAPDVLAAHGEYVAYLPSTLLHSSARPTPQGRPRSIMDALHQLGVGHIQPSELGVPKYEKLLLSTRRITETDLARAIALHKDLRYVDLPGSPPEHDVQGALSHRVIEDHKTVPWRREGGKLIVLTDNPYPTHLRGSIEADAGEDVEIAVAATGAIQATIQDRSLSAKVVQDLHSDAARTAPPEPALDTADESDSAVIRAVNGLIEAAVSKNASDIHLQPSPGGLSVRLRVNGRLTLYQELPAASASAVLTRVKLMADMKPEQRDLPQDKRIAYRHGKVDVILRVNTLRTGHGGLEKIVMRVVQRNRPIPRLEDLDLNERNTSVMQEALTLREGMILMTGPTGSGKTTTTYAMLNVLNSPDRNIQTIEQPIEFDLPGITQTPVNPEAVSQERRLDFERALEALMRQDPDVIMVGEVRTRTTAGIAAQAALTGHLVISTLHAGGAVATVRRLLDLGLEPFTIADTLRVVISQRLVGRPCPKCSVEVPAPASHFPNHTHRTILGSVGRLSDTGQPTLSRQGTPCPHCDGTGVHGRVAVHEVLRVTPAIQYAIYAGASGQEILRLAREDGLTTLLEDGLEKVMAKEATLESLLASFTAPPESK